MLVSPRRFVLSRLSDADVVSLADGDRTQRRVEAWLAAGGAQRLSAIDMVITCAVQCALEPADVATALQRRPL